MCEVLGSRPGPLPCGPGLGSHVRLPTPRQLAGPHFRCGSGATLLQHRTHRGRSQVCKSLTRFSSVDFLPSMICVKSVHFTNTLSRFASVVFEEGLDRTFAQNLAQLTSLLHLWSFKKETERDWVTTSGQTWQRRGLGLGRSQWWLKRSEGGRWGPWRPLSQRRWGDCRLLVARSGH